MRETTYPEKVWDAVVVGGSLAGCTTATLLARAGARVAVVEQRPDPAAFKRICTHFIQSSAVPTLERLGLLGPIAEAGGVRSRMWIWTRWGEIAPPPVDVVPEAVDIRREKLDPMVRELAAGEPGVELLLGEGVAGLLRDGDAVAGVELSGGRRIRARLVVGADGRDSTVAKLAGVRRKVTPHGRFGYAAYYEGPPPRHGPDGQVWMLDPHWAAAFPTDDGLTMYACMPTKARLPEFRRDRVRALESFVADLPDAPPIRESRRVGPVLGKLEMPNVRHAPVAPGLALAGDAALATDPLWGVGCGWAFQMGEWLADGVAPALRGEEPLDAGLARYRRRQRRALNGHVFLIDDYASGRRFQPPERALFSAAARDPRVAERLGRFGTRNAGPGAILGPAALAGVAAAHAKRLRPGTRGRAPAQPRLAA